MGFACPRDASIFLRGTITRDSEHLASMHKALKPGDIHA